MKKFTMISTLIFESDKDMEDYDNLNEAFEKGLIKISIPEISMLGEDGEELVDGDFSEELNKVLLCINKEEV